MKVRYFAYQSNSFTSFDCASLLTVRIDTSYPFKLMTIYIITQSKLRSRVSHNLQKIVQFTGSTASCRKHVYRKFYCQIINNRYDWNYNFTYSRTFLLQGICTTIEEPEILNDKQFSSYDSIKQSNALADSQTQMLLE